MTHKKNKKRFRPAANSKDKAQETSRERERRRKSSKLFSIPYGKQKLHI
jgi:hypothetical protein